MFVHNGLKEKSELSMICFLHDVLLIEYLNSLFLFFFVLSVPGDNKCEDEGVGQDLA